MAENIISSYRALSMGRYMDICKIAADESRDEVDKEVAILAALYGTTEEDILYLPIAEFRERAHAARFLREPSIDHVRIADRYKMGGFELEPVKDIRKIIVAQYYDFKQYATSPETNIIIEIISLFLIPKGKKYSEGYDVLDVQKAIREEMNVSDAVNLSAFFLIKFRKLIADLLTSSEAEAKKLKDPKEREKILKRIAETRVSLLILTGAGDGSQMLTPLVSFAGASGAKSGRCRR